MHKPVRVRQMARRTNQLQRGSSLDMAEWFEIYDLVVFHFGAIEPFFYCLRQFSSSQRRHGRSTMHATRSQALILRFLRVRSAAAILSRALTDTPLVSRSSTGIRPTLNEWEGHSTQEFRFPIRTLRRIVSILAPAADDAANKPPDTFVAYGHRVHCDTAVLAFLHKYATGGSQRERLLLFGGTDTRMSAVILYMTHHVYIKFARYIEEPYECNRFDLQVISDKYVADYESVTGMEFSDSRNYAKRVVPIGSLDGSPFQTARPGDPDLEQAAYSNFRSCHGFNTQVILLFNGLIGGVHTQLISQHDQTCVKLWNVDVRYIAIPC